MSCIITNPKNGRPSKNHKQLLDFFGNTDAGRTKALEEYNKLFTKEFNDVFLGKDAPLWYDLNSELVGAYDISRFNENLEPELKVSGNNELYYVAIDGSRKYIGGKPFSFLSDKAKDELVQNVIFSALTQTADIASVDFEEDVQINIIDIVDILMPSFDETFGTTKLDRDYLIEKAYAFLKDRKLKIQDAEDANESAYDDVNEFDEDFDENDESTETRSSNAVATKDAFLSNSKNTASANVKLILSFIPKLESFTVENGQPVATYPQSEAGKELGLEAEEDLIVFSDNHEIWRKLEDNLANIFTTVDNEGNVTSVVQQIENVLATMAKKDHSIAYLKYHYFDKFKEEGTTNYKLLQFAQAFHKAQIVFSTTEVSSFQDKLVYKVIDPAAASSKSFKIRNSWKEYLEASQFLNKIVDPTTGVVSYTKNKTDLSTQIAELTALGRNVAKDKKNASFEALAEELQILEKALAGLGIPPMSEEFYQTLLEDFNYTTNTNNNPSTFVYSLIQDAIVASKVLLSTEEVAFIKNGAFVNPLMSSAIYKRISNVLAKTSDLTNESTVLIGGGKTAWTFSLPGYLDIMLAKIKNSLYTNADGVTRNRFIEEQQASSPYYNHVWYENFHDKRFLDQLTITTFSAFQKQGQSKYAKDNKTVEYSDQLLDKIFKTLLPRVETNSKAMHYTPAAGDKGKLLQLKGFDIYNLDVVYDFETNSVKINTQGNVGVNNALDILVDDVEAEYMRAKQAYDIARNSTDNSNKYVNYHLKEVNGEFVAVNKDRLPVGNAVQLQTTPDLSIYEFTDKAFEGIDYLTNEDNVELKKLMYDLNNMDSPFLLSTFDTVVDGVPVRELVREYLAKKLDDRIKLLIKELADYNIIKETFVDERGNILAPENLKIDNRLFKNYLSKYESLGISKEDAFAAALYELAADYTVNGMIANSGYNKLFAGDVAYYKDSVDYNKRIPASYTDGKYLMIDSNEDLYFNAAVINNIVLSAKDLDKLKQGFVDSLKEQKKLMSKAMQAIYTKDYIDNLASVYADQYKKVNTTDAQGWITLDRWKFLKEKLGEWSPSAEQAYQRLKAGNFTQEDIKFAAQPLKGVYFYNKLGVPTYLKYSQAVLVPKLIEGTQLEYLNDSMKKSKTDEVITLDGVKLGALMPVRIHDAEGNLLSGVNLNPYKLSNLHWKLQQQLPVKGMKENMDLGSQLMKNIISNIFPEGDYNGFSGREVIDNVNRITSNLTLISFNETLKSLGLDVNGQIVNKDVFYSKLEKTALDKGVPQFAVEALKRQYSLDAIPQLRYKLQNVISAIFNNNIAKTKTPGGSFIQISNIGVTKKDLSSKTGIYMLKDVAQLERPNFTQNEDGTFSVSSGQIFLPHSFIAKYIPDYQTLNREEFNKKIDSELLKLIGYRIPNQKLSSNQPLEVVGILPPEMGDSIMMYSEITTQTGSDFDIDKTYVMMPAFDVEYSNKKDLIDTLFKMDETELFAMIESFSDFDEYKENNPLLKEKVNNRGSQKRRTIDYLMDRGLIPENLSQKYVKGLRYVKPIVQEVLETQGQEVQADVETQGQVQTTEETKSVDYSNYTNYSGAAEGGDTVWENIGKEFGLGKQVNYRPEDLKKLTEEQLKEVEDAYQKAVVDLGRKPLDKNTFSGGLVRRDYLQAKAADAVFAISTIINPGEKDKKGYVNKTNKQVVEGGTGYAVQMAINLDKPVYVFDQIKNKWFVWDNNNFVKTDTPTLTKKFAGIGTREINENGKIAIKNVYQNIKQFQETKSVNKAKATYKAPSKKELQNELFELYYKVLSSPLSYADMMSGIDGSVIKDTIEDLHGIKDKLTSLQLLDPTYQLQIKFDNIVGKSGVGVTANQLVDHVFNQIAGVEMKAKSLRYFSKYLNTTEHGIDLSQIFDIEGNKISDSVSMFLNAFVDIAKDAYITRGNFNVHTLNPTFLLLRGGMPIKQVIAYMGQPILKDAIKVFQSKLSSLDKMENKTELLNNSLKEVTYDLEQKIDNIITKSGVLVDTNAKTSAFSYKTLAGTIKNKEYYEGLIQMYSNPNRMEAMKKENYEEFVKNINSLIGYKNFQVKVADSYKALHKDGELLSEQVLTSKSDVNGGGHDIATHFSNNNRFNKVRDSGVFKNFDVKFDSDTMLGAKTLYTLRYFSSLDENLFITMHPNIKPIYNMVSRLIKGDDYASNVNTIKKVEQSMYGTLVHKALEKTPYEITKKDIKRLFFPGNGIAEKIVNLKLNPKYVNNKLIQNLETFKEDNMTFLSADNFVRKPDSVLTDLSNAWSELLNSEDKLDKEVAIDLVKYAIATSGLAKNRHSIFEFMPIEVADYLDRGIAKMKSEGISDIFTNFIENFLRHVQNESYLPKVNSGVLKAKNGTMSEKELEKIFGLVNVDPRVLFVKKGGISNLSQTETELRDNEMNKLKHYKIVNIGSSVYEYAGDITSLDGKGDIMVLAPSYRLGRQFGNKGTQEVANANIYEYGTKETMFKENLPGKYESIKQTLDTVRENLQFEEHTFNLEGTLQYYGKNIQVMDYNGKAAYAELVKRGIVKENKC